MSSWELNAKKFISFLKNEGFGLTKIPEVFLMPSKIKFVFTMKIGEQYCNIPQYGNINIILTKTLLYATKRPDKKNEKTQTMIKELEKQIHNSTNPNDIKIKTELITKLKLSDENYISTDSLMAIAFKIHNTMFESYTNAEIMYNIFVNLLVPKIIYEPSNIKEFKFKQDDSWRKQPNKQDIVIKKYDTKYVPKFEAKELAKQTNKYVIPAEKERNINIAMNDGFITLSEIINEKPLNVFASNQDLDKLKEEEEKKEKYLSSLSLDKYLEYRILHPEEFPLKLAPIPIINSVNSDTIDDESEEEDDDYYINIPHYSNSENYSSDDEEEY